MNSSAPNTAAPAPETSTHVTLDPERCQGCLLCVDVCPNELFAPGSTPNQAGDLPVEMHHPEYCINCLNCVQICPDRAFEVPELPRFNLEGRVFGLSLRWHRFWNRHDR